MNAVAAVSGLVLSGLLLGAELASAQGRVAPTGPESRTALVVQSLIGVGRRSEISTPEFQTRTPFDRPRFTVGGSRGNTWTQILVTYDTLPEWIDAVTFNYQVLTATRDSKGQRQYGLHRRTVTYIDIAAGRGHQSAVYLHPTTVARYGETVAVHVDVLVGGNVVAAQDDLDPAMKGQLPEKWWDSKLVLENEKTRLLEGYLKHRDETPFALVNIDSQEVIR